MHVRDYTADTSTRIAALTEATRRIWINKHIIRAMLSQQCSRYWDSFKISASILLSQKNTAVISFSSY